MIVLDTDINIKINPAATTAGVFYYEDIAINVTFDIKGQTLEELLEQYYLGIASTHVPVIE